jgi:hypothetical protein
MSCRTRVSSRVSGYGGRVNERYTEWELTTLGQPGDALAGKKAELEKSMLEVSH